MTAPNSTETSSLFTEADPAPATVLPVTPRRRGLGLQGKLALSLVSIIAIALSACSGLFASKGSEQLEAMMDQQARLAAYALSLAAASPMISNRRAPLEAMGRQLLKTRSILYVAFYDAERHPLVLSHRYADFGWKDTSALDPEAELNQPSFAQSGRLLSGVFGQHLDVCARVTPLPRSNRGDGLMPVLSFNTSFPGVALHNPDETLGYVVIGVSLEREQAQLSAVNWYVLAIGGCLTLTSLPVVYLLVYGFFRPVRQLVDATQKMAVGRTDFDIDATRSDLIGELARSFQEMVRQIRLQREDLAATNSRLADANRQLGLANFQLAEANRDLEAKVGRRTAQLETANARLNIAMDEKEDFLRTVSHDLGAPLRNIDGMASMLLHKHRDQFNDDAVRRLERIQKNVQVQTELIAELLELSRIKTRRQKMETVDVGTIVRDLGELLEEDLSSRQIVLIVDSPLAPITAERLRVRQVFQNLIDNAIKYMGDGPVREIHVGCLTRPDEVEFYVRDTGLGIEPDDMARVFNVFRRGRGTAVQNVPGKGVGLASVKSIVETYSGNIWVESEAGKGSTFRFTINGMYAASEGGARALPPAAGEVGPAGEDPQPDRRAA